MSLWYESLGMALYDCGDNAAEKVKNILAYLSMPVPRSWWEAALQTGDVRNWASVLIDLQLELTKSLGLPEKPGTSLLVALAFIDDEEPQTSPGRFESIASNYTPDEYFARAPKIKTNKKTNHGCNCHTYGMANRHAMVKSNMKTSIPIRLT